MKNLDMLSPDELDSYVGHPDFIIIDVREPEEFQAGHIRGAKNIPYKKLLGQISLSKEKTIILYCSRGSASLAAGRRMALQGYDVLSVVGGIREYRGRNMIR